MKVGLLCSEVKKLFDQGMSKSKFFGGIEFRSFCLSRLARLK